MVVKFTVTGDPFGWQRAGQNHYTGATFKQQKTLVMENAVAWEYKKKYQSQMFSPKSALCLYVIAYMPIPKSTPKATREKMLSGEIRPTVKPDWDNIGKLISDALNGIAYDDDKSIVDGCVRKFYSDEPRTEITIQEAS